MNNKSGLSRSIIGFDIRKSSTVFVVSANSKKSLSLTPRSIKKRFE